jgi:hypothetical protein
MRNDERERARALMVKGVEYSDACWMARVHGSWMGGAINWGSLAVRRRGVERVVRLAVLHCAVASMRVHRWGWRAGWTR